MFAVLMFAIFGGLLAAVIAAPYGLVAAILAYTFGGALSALAVGLLRELTFGKSKREVARTQHGMPGVLLHRKT